MLPCAGGWDSRAEVDGRFRLQMVTELLAFRPDILNGLNQRGWLSRPMLRQARQ